MAINIKWLAGALVLFVLPFSVLAQAESEVQLPDAGTTPDSFVYGLDVALEKIALALTFDEGKRVEKRLEFAEERLAEVRAMVLEKKFEAMEKAKIKYADLLQGVKTDFVEIENGDVEAELRKELELERKFKQHGDKVKEVESELKAKVRVEGELTPEQMEMISAILDSLKGQSGEVEIEIENEKGKTKIKIELETDEDADELEATFKDEMGITEEERQRALQEMDRVRNNLESFFAQAGISTAPEHVQEIRSLIEQAQGAFAVGDYDLAHELGESIREIMDDRMEEAIKQSLEHRQDFRQETPRRAVVYRPEDWEKYWEGFEKLREEAEEKRDEIERDLERFREEMEEREEVSSDDDDLEEEQGLWKRYQEESSGQSTDDEGTFSEEEHSASSGTSSGGTESSSGSTSESSSGESGSSGDSSSGSYSGYEGHSG